MTVSIQEYIMYLKLNLFKLEVNWLGTSCFAVLWYVYHLFQLNVDTGPKNSLPVLCVMLITPPGVRTGADARFFEGGFEF